MKVSEFIGHGAEVEHLMRSVQAGRIVHACILAGPQGGGKRSLAEILVGAALCASPEKEKRPCGFCPACKRVAAGTHPDILNIRPEGKSIGVEAVRAMIQFLSTKPYEGGCQAVVVEQAEKMTPSAQNALLKTLEEPSGEAMVLLLTDAPGALLSTIRSRCRLVRIPRLTGEMCSRALTQKGISQEQADFYAALSQGSVGRALEMMEDAGYLALREKVYRSLSALKDAASVAEAASGIVPEAARAQEILEIFELAARNRLAAEAGLPLLAPEPCALALDGQAMLSGVLRLRQMLSSNVSWPAALERYYFSILEER
ncbi:MAG TPA: DNA polymerase III subunit delta' [Candidatus Pullichristensenella excrementigallinarum]|uniref:DNA polymerase III subunit delta n=1 Tax=Candidatus Pullichristensenella excrementigallinarum TaxID=2840907 RepID=A0A9D1LA55_9FIRM|nr:DNA polymerase III subunit delta' [Candidatus Pullichristensenella excrementigallinarum]